jgi:hypothetical protein
MIWVLYVILWVLAALFGLLMLVVVVPIHLRGRGSVKGLAADGAVEVRWGWGFFKVTASRRALGEVRLLGLPIWRYRAKSAAEKQREKEKKKAKKRNKKHQTKEKKPKKEQTSGSLKALGAWLNRKALLELLRRVLVTLRVRLAIEGRLGLGDPADTALAVTAIRQLDARIKYVCLQVAPEYEQDVLDLRAAFFGRFWLLHIAVVFVVALFNRDIRRALMALV